MKRTSRLGAARPETAFSALGRAVWDETEERDNRRVTNAFPFSALGRAVWDETGSAPPKISY